MGSLHAVGSDRTHTVWDNSIVPVLEIEPGETVELEVTDASGGQLDRRRRGTPRVRRSPTSPSGGEGRCRRRTRSSKRGFANVARVLAIVFAAIGVVLVVAGVL